MESFYRFNFKSIEHNNERAVNCFEFSALNSQNFIVALEGKLLLRCSTAVTSSSLIGLINFHCY